MPLKKLVFITCFNLITLPAFAHFWDFHDLTKIFGEYKVELTGILGQLFGPSMNLKIKENSRIALSTSDGKLNCQSGQYILKDNVLVAHLFCLDRTKKRTNFDDCDMVTSDGDGKEPSNCVKLVTASVNLSNVTPEQLEDKTEIEFNLHNDTFTKTLKTEIALLKHLDNGYTEFHPEGSNQDLFEVEIINNKEVSLKSIGEEMECSPASFKRVGRIIIAHMICIDRLKSIDCDSIGKNQNCLRVVTMALDSHEQEQIMNGDSMPVNLLYFGGQKLGTANINIVSSGEDYLDPFDKPQN